MTLLIAVFAVINVAMGFLLAIYLGKAQLPGAVVAAPDQLRSAAVEEDEVCADVETAPEQVSEADSSDDEPTLAAEAISAGAETLRSELAKVHQDVPAKEEALAG